MFLIVLINVADGGPDLLSSHFFFLFKTCYYRMKSVNAKLKWTTNSLVFIIMFHVLRSAFIAFCFRVKESVRKLNRKCPGRKLPQSSLFFILFYVILYCI